MSHHKGQCPACGDYHTAPGQCRAPVAAGEPSPSENWLIMAVLIVGLSLGVLSVVADFLGGVRP